MIHPAASVHPEAVLGRDVRIGAFAVVEQGVVLGAGCQLAEHVVLRRGVELGEGVTVDSFSVLGGMPQMRGWTPVPSSVKVGARTVIREAVTINRPTKEGACTSIGADCYLMANSHVGHDCAVGDFVTLANNVMLAGHVHVGAYTFVGGGAGIHQFVRIGEGVMVAGNAAISYDVPPFAMAADRNDICGLNLVGLRRRGIAASAVVDIKRCFRSVFAGTGNVRARAEAALASGSCGSEAQGRLFLEFFSGGKRGFAQSRRHKHGSGDAASD